MGTLDMTEQQHSLSGCADGAHLVDCERLVRRRDGALVGQCVDCGVWAVVRVLSALLREAA